MYSGHEGQPCMVSNKTSSKILLYSQKKYRFQPSQIGLNLKQKDDKKSDRKFTRTKYINLRIYKLIRYRI